MVALLGDWNTPATIVVLVAPYGSLCITELYSSAMYRVLFESTYRPVGWNDDIVDELSKVTPVVLQSAPPDPPNDNKRRILRIFIKKFLCILDVIYK